MSLFTRASSWLKRTRPLHQSTRPSPSWRPTLHLLESRLTPASSLLVSGADFGSEPQVRVFDDAGAVRFDFLAYDASFLGGVRVASGDVNGDGTPDIITAAGPGGGPHVKVFSGTDLTPLASFFAFDAAFSGGVSVAAGNLDGDGRADLIVGAGPGGGPHVKAFSGGDLHLLQSFYAYDPTFAGGVNVAAGDFDGDFRDDILTGAGAGGGPHVKAFSGQDLHVLTSFFAYATTFAGGVNVAAGDVNHDGTEDIITGSGTNNQVRAFDGVSGASLASFFPFGTTAVNGVTVAAVDVNGDGAAEIVSGAGAGGSGSIRLFDVQTQTPLSRSLVFAPGFLGGVSVSGTELTFGPVLHGPDTADASFVDPTAEVLNPDHVEIDHKVYVGPFATLDATHGSIAIGEGSNVQDNVLIQASETGGVEIGDHIILAHGVSVFGPATIGTPGGLPVFISFNAVIDGATLEPDTVVSALARVGPGVILHSGMKVLPGKLVLTQAQADDPALGKVTAVTAGDRTLIAGILEVNENFARGYAALFNDGGRNAVLGVSLDPGDSTFNTSPDLPNLAGSVQAHPTFRNRIIGDIHFANTFAELNLVLGDRDSFRTDEGTPFEIGTIAHADDRVTVHALEHTEVTIGNNSTFGYHVVIHGGPDSGNAPVELTRIGDDVVVKDWGVVFRSTLGKNVTIGFRALVDGSQLADGTIVPDRAIIIDNVVVGSVEW